MSETLRDDRPPTSPSSIGYRRLADYMAWDPPTAIFERFRSANYLNLLGLQAEIARLQDELMKTTVADEAQDNQPLRKEYQYNWPALQDGEDGKSRQRELIMELRKALKEYNTALIHQITIGNQPNPISRDLHRLCNWIENPYGLASDLRGPGSRLWFSKVNGEYEVADKLVLLPESERKDSFTELLSKGLSNIFFVLEYFCVRQIRSFPASREVYRDPEPEKDFKRFTTTGAIIGVGDKLVTVIACLLITVPVVVINYINNTGLRLLFIILSSLAFSLALAFLSNAQRKDIFAATAAFVAVQVVFVGTGGNVSG
ncbi:hypothetical protein GGR58DRAFT_493856 [Xylaria digitata]|nr:hypothetical protein GGR58DRAFT_493856 [Xylaria digitata]